MLYRRGEVWWLKFKRGGRTIRLSTGETDRRRAGVEAAKLLLRAENPRIADRKGALPRLVVCGGIDVETAQHRDQSEGYITALRSMWRALVGHFGADATLDAVTTATLIEYEGARRRAGIRGQTIRKEIGCLKRAFQRAYEDGVPVEAPRRWPRIKSDSPHPSRTGRLVERETLFAFLAQLPQILRDEMLFAALTGLRQGELHAFALSWIERGAAGWQIRVPQDAAKNRRTRTTALRPAAQKILARYRHVSGPIFARERWRYRAELRAAAEAVGLEGHGVTLRDLRTTYATLSLAATGDAAAVQAALGHSDLRTTQRYQRTTLARTQAVGDAVALALAPPKSPWGHKKGHSPTRRKKRNR